MKRDDQAYGFVGTWFSSIPIQTTNASRLGMEMVLVANIEALGNCCL